MDLDVSKSIFIDRRNGDYFVSMWFLGASWTLRTAGQMQNWMIYAPDNRILIPLKHFKDFEFEHPRQMSFPYDTPIKAVEQAKFQLFRLKYKKTTPSFHEQHFNQFPIS